MEAIQEAGNAALKAATKVELPSNETIVSGIDKAKKALKQTVLENSGVSGAPKKIAKEVEGILESVENFLNENNEGNALQSFFENSKKTIEEMTEEVKGNAGKSKKLKGDLEEIFSSSKDLFLALFKDKELRELCMNSFQLFQKFLVTITKSKGIEVPEEILEKLGMSEENSGTKKRKTAKGAKKSPKKITEKEMKEFGNEVLETLQNFGEKEEFQKALDSFFKLFKHVYQRVEDIKENSELSLDKNSSLKKTLEDGKKVLEGFTGIKSLDSLFGSFSGLLSLDSKDLKEYFNSWSEFLGELKEKPELLKNAKEASKKIGELVHKGKDLFQEDSIRDAFNSFFGESWNFLESIKPENVGSKLASGTTGLMSHLLGSDGKITLSSFGNALPQIKSIIVPLVLSQLDKLPFPKLEGKTDSMSWAVEGIQFSASEVLTERIKIDFHTTTDVNVKDLSNEISKAELTVVIRGIKSSLKNIKFEYKRESFPAIQDAGVADVTVGGEGADLMLKWFLEAEGSSAPQVVESEVACSVDKLDIFVKEAHHETLDSIVTSLFSGFLKGHFEEQIEKNVIKLCTKVAVELNKVLSYSGKEERTPSAK